MRYLTAAFLMVILGALIMSLIPQPQTSVTASKIKIAKKLGALLLLHKKKYLFAVPFPLPIPIPILKKSQPIIYKEKVAVPVPVPEPVPVPVQEPTYDHGYNQGYNEGDSYE